MDKHINKIANEPRWRQGRIRLALIMMSAGSLFSSSAASGADLLLPQRKIHRMVDISDTKLDFNEKHRRGKAVMDKTKIMEQAIVDSMLSMCILYRRTHRGKSCTTLMNRAIKQINRAEKILDKQDPKYVRKKVARTPKYAVEDAAALGNIISSDLIPHYPSKDSPGRFNVTMVIATSKGDVAIHNKSFTVSIPYSQDDIAGDRIFKLTSFVKIRKSKLKKGKLPKHDIILEGMISQTLEVENQTAKVLSYPKGFEEFRGIIPITSDIPVYTLKQYGDVRYFPLYNSNFVTNIIREDSNYLLRLIPASKARPKRLKKSSLETQKTEKEIVSVETEAVGVTTETK